MPVAACHILYAIFWVMILVSAVFHGEPLSDQLSMEGRGRWAKTLPHANPSICSTSPDAGQGLDTTANAGNYLSQCPVSRGLDSR